MQHHLSSVAEYHQCFEKGPIVHLIYLGYPHLIDCGQPIDGGATLLQHHEMLSQVDMEFDQSETWGTSHDQAQLIVSPPF